MTREKFEKLVNKLEVKARENPKWYRAQVVAFAGLAYVYIWLFLLLFSALFIGLAVDWWVNGKWSLGRINAMITSGVLIYFIIRAMMVRAEMPDGVELTREEAPGLFETLDELKERMKAPEIHKVLVDEDFNASVMQYSTYMLFGRKQHILKVGFPLLLTLSPEQMKSVLAHELAHVSHADTKLGARIYRLGSSMEQLLKSLEKNDEKLGTWIFRPFFRWFVPRFSAWSFVMRRTEEYRADAKAAEMTSPQVAGEALIHIHVKRHWYSETFMGDHVLDEVRKNGSVTGLFSLYLERMQQVPDEEWEKILKMSLAEDTDLTDTHPSLRERLEALGVTPALPEPVKRTSLETFMEDPDQWLAGFNHLWDKIYGDDVRSAVRYHDTLEQLFEHLRDKKERTPRETADLVMLMLKRNGPGAALNLLRETPEKVREAFEFGKVHMILANVLVQSGRVEEAVPLIETAVRQDWEVREDGLRFLGEWYEKQGDEENIRRIAKERDGWRNYLVKTDDEIEDFKNPKRWKPADLPEAAINSLVEDFMEWDTVDALFLVELELSRGEPQRSHYVLGVVHDYSEMGMRDIMRAMKAFDEWMENEWESSLPVTVLDLTNEEKLLDEIVEIEDSLIFCREEDDEEEEEEAEEHIRA
ncbi:M48 family metallopeptidase [Staphylospora marina]|uniref:M48 family metallopeptidase n=1 Tax=Staphylospora marina TaxID=2490858 RepID=UPI0013DDFFA9|nr:M48 family metallopeptidase [Staphylospora marina]